MSTNTVEQIKDRLGIAEVVGSYIKLEKAGNNLKARCPFHNEKTPSFMISPDRGTYYCFGCEAKGDIFSFVQEFEGVDFMGALKILADRAGVEIVFDKSSNKDEKRTTLDILESVTDKYVENFSKGEESKKYLEGRGLTEETIKNWRLGFAKNEWSDAMDYLISKKYSVDEIEKAGIIKKGDKGKFYDRLRGRIIFPIFDSSGQVVAFTGRILDKTKDEAKYINSPETSVFKKSKVLYGYHLAKPGIRKNDFSILVEGQMDVLMAHQAGYTNTVASSGTALTDEQIELLNRMSEKLVIALDGDGAGIKASTKAFKIALSKGMDVKIAAMPEGSDPADLILKDPEEWKKRIRESKHVIEFMGDVIEERVDDKRKQSQAIYTSIIPYVFMIKNELDQSYFIEYISNRFNINESSLREAVKNYNPEEPVSLSKEKEVSERKKENFGLRKQLLGLILWQDSKKDSDIDAIEIKKKLSEFDPEIEKDLELMKDNQEHIIFEIEKYYSETKTIETVIKDVLNRYIESKLIKDRSELKISLKKAEAEKDENKARELIDEINQITLKINSLKGG